MARIRAGGPARNVLEHGLQVGDVGTVVHRYEDGAAVEVRFVTARGKTIAVLTLGVADVSPLQGEQKSARTRLASA